MEKAALAWFMMVKIKKPVMISWNHDPQKTQSLFPQKEIWFQYG